MVRDTTFYRIVALAIFEIERNVFSGAVLIRGPQKTAHGFPPRINSAEKHRRTTYVRNGSLRKRSYVPS